MLCPHGIRRADGIQNLHSGQVKDLTVCPSSARSRAANIPICLLESTVVGNPVETLKEDQTKTMHVAADAHTSDTKQRIGGLHPKGAQIDRNDISGEATTQAGSLGASDNATKFSKSQSSGGEVVDSLSSGRIHVCAIISLCPARVACGL